MSTLSVNNLKQPKSFNDIKEGDRLYYQSPTTHAYMVCINTKPNLRLMYDWEDFPTGKINDCKFIPNSEHLRHLYFVKKPLLIYKREEK